MHFQILFLINCVFGANILYISPVASRSHHIWNRVLALHLNMKGHNVTMLSHDDENVKPTNFTIILLEGIYKLNFQSYTTENLYKTNSFSGIKLLYDLSQLCCEHDLDTKGLQTLMNYPRDFKFDLIIFDVTLKQCLYPLIYRFNNPPVVAVTPFLLSPVFSHILGNPLQPSYFPYYSTRIPPFEEVERNISILLCNTDPNLEYPLDLPPNIIPVGGLQVQPPKPLPTDLRKIVENAKNGVIVFSLGTFLRSDDMSESKTSAMLTAFSKLSETVIWKFESSKMKNVPKNVIIKSWLPQSDLLGHPNVKLLINHGGALSSQEAMHYGIPVVAIPFFADQFANAARLENKMMGKVVNFNTITSKTFHDVIKEVLTNPMYRKNIQALSTRYKDRLNTPLDTATFWVEYVLRHGGAEHFSLAARDMFFYESMGLEIYAILLFSPLVLYYLIGLIFLVFKVIVKTFIDKI
ncbi:hypothetical protein FQA39_LY04965 [Lamprigera yunnana]|nr:hypothetical protein FQA39_LY04965 [Lamprigera yunnana]